MFDSVKAGREIAVQRKKMSLTQEELDVRLSISPQVVSKWGGWTRYSGNFQV
ncbi:helix-turn-helix domain-containing protein [Acutalibacter sp. 1XD8-36]|uniref:helix-turn-helix domain-containing protein n=1 Tax=Acutalibacter sp. 1XD8-36 TaxID=2320852 RepID=UPI002631CC96|nr:helix-turn-helix transcriptional regulator [Acutalibacter sp. 1XD8-36]